MTLTPILELPADVQLPESVANELNMRLLWIGQQLKQLAAQSGQSSAANGGAGAAQASGAGMVIGTRSQRLTIAAYDANNFKGEQFFETDTMLVYISAPLSAGGKGYVWKYMSGTARGTFGARLAGLGSLDTGLLYYAIDRSLTYRWNGSWAILVNYEPIIADTLANWTLANYNPANYAPGQPFFIEDWTVTYICELVAGVLTWVYQSGVYRAATASRPTTAFNGEGLGAPDAGLRFIDTTLNIQQYWNGTAWISIGSSGSAPTGPAGGGLGGNYPDPTVKEAAGNFTVLGTQAEIRNTTGPTQFIANFTAGQYGGLWIYQDGTTVSQFIVFGPDSYWNYAGTLNLGPQGGANAITLDATGNATFNQLLTLTSRTVASLPFGPTGSIAYVNDAVAPVAGSPVTGGGGIGCLVWFDFNTWKVFAA